MAAKKRDGIVYSTNPDFEYDDGSGDEEITLPPSRQLLYVWIDSKNRSGKTVTLIKGFKGNSNDLEDLSASLKKSLWCRWIGKKGRHHNTGRFQGQNHQLLKQ